MAGSTYTGHAGATGSWFAPVERQIYDALIFDDRSDRRVVCIEQRSAVVTSTTSATAPTLSYPYGQAISKGSPAHSARS